MCTVTWAHRDGGYTLFFNRDELRTRPPERPPRRWNSRGVSFLAPLDDGGGGTWIAANEHGLTAALLNHYARETKSPERPRSRGSIPLLATGHKSVAETVEWAKHASMIRFKPFLLALVDTGGDSALLTWDGNKLAVARQVRLPITTSSFCPKDVERAREAQFLDFAPSGSCASPEALEAFHRSRNSRGDAWSVWMSRVDACTRSLIRVDVGSQTVRMHYEPAHPGFALLDSRADNPTTATLPRTESILGRDAKKRSE